ncbi:MAG: AAA family ATPase, partial [Solirubrobacteraceae bacterium]
MATKTRGSRTGRPRVAPQDRDAAVRTQTGSPDKAGARELQPADLRRICPPESLHFTSTEELVPPTKAVGQSRAQEAISFGLGAPMPGYNVFVTGPVGVGKRTFVEAQLRDHAARRTAPGDWVYLHNFSDPRRPLAVALGRGESVRLAADMPRFLQEARNELTAAFESDSYAARRREVTEPVEREQESALQQLRDQARAQGIEVELTPTGVVTVPLRGARPMTPAEFAQLPDSVRARYQASLETIGPMVQTFMTRARSLQRDARDRLRELEREVAMFAIGHQIDELKQSHRDCPRLAEWLDAVAGDVVEHLSELRPGSDGDTESTSLMRALAGGQDGLARYEVNAFVTREDGNRAPVVFETNPTYTNLFGRLEHQGVLGGGFVTDHRMLRPGAVHRANGGYLILPAAEVLTQPLVWLKLKEVLRTREIRLENLAEQYALFPTATLTPEPIALDLKVVLIGSPLLYELAYMADEDVRKLFRVRAEFDSRMPWDDEHIGEYCAFLGSQVRQHGLLHFDAGAAARVVEHGARLAEGQRWLSTRFVEVAGLATEASHWATQDGSPVVRAQHVQRAIAEKVRRSDLIERRLLEMVSEGTLMLDFKGARVGQANGLAVLELGDYSFGHPVRITATAGPGRGSLLSSERETELSGHIHDKG